MRTLRQRDYATLADANRKAIQRDGFVDGLTDSDIQESLWEEDIDGFGPNIERVLRLDSIDKDKQMRQRRRATPEVRHVYYGDDLNFEYR